MQITVYKNFNKRINSTKSPASGGTTLNVVIKDYSNIETPSFTLTVSNIDQNSGFLDVNYVEAFGRKYFATCNVETSTSFSIDCTLDHLATFKSNVAGYTGLVNYTSASSNVFITDPRNKPTLEYQKSVTNMSWVSDPFASIAPSAMNGCYILSVISDEGGGVSGPNQYYVLDSMSLSGFMHNLCDSNLWDAIKNKFNNVVDSLVSCMWLPINYSAVPGVGVTYISVGGTHINPGGAAKIVTNRIVELRTANTLITYPEWPDIGSIYRTYLAKAPYLTAEIYLPFIGWVPLSDDLISYQNSVVIYGTIDCLTGDIVYELQSGGTTVSSYNGCCGTKIPISATSYDGFGITTGALTVIGGLAATAVALATGGAATAVMGGAAAAVAGSAATLRSCSINTMINGGNSSAIAATIGVYPQIVLVASKPIETDLLAYQDEQGMPYFKTATLSSLSGYIQCADASVSIPGNGSEQSVVNGYLNSGFYLE